VRRACLNGNIISNPVIIVAKVFLTTIIGTFRRNNHQNWQSVTRTASERWEIDLVKEIWRDVKVGDSLSNLIIEIHRIKLRCTHFSSSFQKGWDNTTSSCKGSSAAFMPWSTSPDSSEMSIAYSDSGCATVGDGTKRFRGGWWCMLWAGRGHT